MQGDSLFKHQYMTNVAGAAKEGQILGSAYDDIMLQMPHEFKIPLYKNMPETNCPIPTGDGSPNNKLKNLAVANYVLTPTFNPDHSDYSVVVDAGTNSVFVGAEAYDKKAAVGGIGNILTMTSYTTVVIYCVAENGTIRQYNIKIFRPGVEGSTYNPYNMPQVLVPTNTGIQIGVDNNVQNNIGNNTGPSGPGGQINNGGGTLVQIGVAPGM